MGIWKFSRGAPKLCAAGGIRTHAIAKCVSISFFAFFFMFGSFLRHFPSKMSSPQCAWGDFPSLERTFQFKNFRRTATRKGGAALRQDFQIRNRPKPPPVHAHAILNTRWQKTKLEKNCAFFTSTSKKGTLPPPSHPLQVTLKSIKTSGPNFPKEKIFPHKRLGFPDVFDDAEFTFDTHFHQ